MKVILFLIIFLAAFTARGEIYELKASGELPTVAATNIDLSGLDINADEGYFFFITGEITGGGTYLKFYFNGDYTDSNLTSLRLTTNVSNGLARYTKIIYL